MGNGQGRPRTGLPAAPRALEPGVALSDVRDLDVVVLRDDAGVPCAVYALGKGFAVLALGDELYRYAAAGERTACADCCTWVYCPCIKWWWLVVQGGVMAVAAALQLAALFQRRRSTSMS